MLLSVGILAACSPAAQDTPTDPLDSTAVSTQTVPVSDSVSVGNDVVFTQQYLTGTWKTQFGTCKKDPVVIDKSGESEDRWGGASHEVTNNRMTVGHEGGENIYSIKVISADKFEARDISDGTVVNWERCTTTTQNSVNRETRPAVTAVSYEDYPPIQRTLRGHKRIIWIDEDDRDGYHRCQSANVDMGDRFFPLGIYCTEVGSGAVQAYSAITDTFYTCLPNAASCSNTE